MSRMRGLYFRCDFCQKHNMTEERLTMQDKMAMYPPPNWMTVIAEVDANTLDFCSRTCLADYFRHDVSNVPEKPSEIKITEEEDRAQRHPRDENEVRAGGDGWDRTPQQATNPEDL